jgi:hypothetical protein
VAQTKTLTNPKCAALAAVAGNMHSVLVSNSLREPKKAEPTVVPSAGRLRCTKCVMNVS